ncbi:nucleotidyltransferase domain-containing protein [Photobacterium sagamiensis]|uniref:nucleotidyltransferase domain-containing protein n=1 Tax=Photobacterium sagamiensis TaxID=2910241 RepID=UPI003D0DA8B7
MVKALPVLDGKTPFQQEYVPVLLDAVKQLRAGFGASLHSIYLFGSIARREAVLGQSDLNLTLILHRPLTVSEQSLLNTIKWRISTYHTDVPSVEIKVGYLSEVLSLDAIFKWGFWIKHCCLCLYGEDLSTRFGCFEPSWDVAKAFNGDIKDELAVYRQKIMKTKVVSNYLEYCQHIAKKMLRSCFSLVMHREKRWAHTSEGCAEAFLKYYPDKSLEIERLFTLISGTQVPKRAALFLLDQFGGWIVAEFEKIDRKIG